MGSVVGKVINLTQRFLPYAELCAAAVLSRGWLGDWAEGAGFKKGKMDSGLTGLGFSILFVGCYGPEWYHSII